MDLITKEQTTLSVFEAAEENKYLVIGEKCFLETLDKDMDGIFETPQSWSSFLISNLLYSASGYALEKPKQTTIKKWCYNSEQYIDKFCVKIGNDRYLLVSSDDVVLEFDYELFYSRQDNFPASVEFYVTGALK